MPPKGKAKGKAPAKLESLADNEPDAEPTAPPGCVPFNISGKDMEKHNLKNGNHRLNVGGKRLSQEKKKTNEILHSTI
jgi:hypothetical protein